MSETLETILGGPRTNSGFFSEPDSRTGKDVGNLPGLMVDDLHDAEQVSIPTGQRSAYQRALSVDAKPMGAEVSGGGIAGRRNAPCPTFLYQESMDSPVRPVGVSNGFPGNLGLRPPQTNTRGVGRGIGMPPRSGMSGPGEWGLSRSSANSACSPVNTGIGRSGPMGAPMINRSNSVPGATRSMLQQQLMETGPNEPNMGMSLFGSPTPQSPSWPDSSMGMEKPQSRTNRDQFGFSLDELLGPLSASDGPNVERALLDQLDSLLNTADVMALQAIDRELGIPEIVGQSHGPEGPQQGQDQSQCPSSEPFVTPDSSMGMDQKTVYNQGYPGPPGPSSISMQPGYRPNTMQSQPPGGFNPMVNQMNHTGGFPGMSGIGNIGNPRLNMVRPRMMNATKPLRLQLQQRLQGQQFMNQTRQSMKLDSAPGGPPSLRPGMQSGMGPGGMSNQSGFLNAQMMAQRSREMMTLQMKRQRMMMLMQQQQQQQNQGPAGGFSMSQQGESSFIAPGSGSTGNLMPGRMPGPGQNNMMTGMQGNPRVGICIRLSYPQQQFSQHNNQVQFGPMMMNNSTMGGPGPVSGAGGGQMGQMPGQMQSQMGMNPMGMARMTMGPDQKYC
ncbi:hypothetical protein WMY93_016063 [Mugilogobius chulae]|uniref:Nuclear receptor coactivator Ncoa-type interlocking domain-containing protein n=1 Tax=Mugilogobius chulae TaxID=88201 RepID=A0AAW0NWS1_9GOBI